MKPCIHQEMIRQKHVSVRQPVDYDFSVLECFDITSKHFLHKIRGPG